MRPTSRHHGAWLRAVAASAAALALAAVPTVASAATAPSVSGPTPASLRLDRPEFRWINGPAGEHVERINVRTDPAVAPDGRLTGAFAANVPTAGTIAPTATSARTDLPLTSGTYHWNALWRDPAQPSVPQYTPVRSFSIAPRIGNVRITRVRVNARSWGIGVELVGTVASNTPQFTIACTLRRVNGRVLSRQTLVYRSQVPSAKNPMGCLRLTAPVGAAGSRARVTVRISSQGRSAQAQRVVTLR